MMRSINPATEEVIAETELHSDAETDRRLSLAHDRQLSWRKTSLQERQAVLTRVAARLRTGRDQFARLITVEMGKPIEEAKAEIEKCAFTCDYYATNAASLLADEVVASSAQDSRVVLDALGVLLAVMPWNYPFWQLIRAAAPAITVGNTVVLKHASNVALCARAIEQVFVEADAPAGLFSTLLVDSKKVSSIIRDERIMAVTFTGSTPVGRSIAQDAGQALKKHVLELGGSDPFIVLADADVRVAARAAAKARFSNTGQSCISSKRFIVEERIAADFVAAFAEEASTYRAGDPLDTATRLGPMARGNLRDELHEQVTATIAEGATLRVGNGPSAGKGYFYATTILDYVEPGMTAAKQETFGPAAAVIRVRDADAAIAVANNTQFGLGASIWTADRARGQALARNVDAGAVFVNAVVASDPRLPFGGVKQSGYGRELGGWGLREFANVKTVYTG